MNRVIEDLMLKHSGIQRGYLIPPADRALLLQHHKETDKRNIYGIRNLSRLFSVTRVYETELAAVYSVAREMRELTDQNNIEFMTVIRVKKDKKTTTNNYYVSGVVAGKHSNVVLATLVKRFLSWPWSRLILIHTHPNCEGCDPNTFSGNPQFRKFSDLGDASVPTILKYQSIYLIGDKGQLYKYEGKGNGANHANNRSELVSIKPLADDLPTSKIKYLWDQENQAFFPVYTK